MLALDRADRPISAHEVLRALREIEATANLGSLIANGETDKVEFKQTMRWDVDKRQPNKDVLRSSVKTVCAFLNGAGGTLLIGVADNGQPVGLDDDLQALKDNDKDKNKDEGTVDQFELTFRQALVNGLDPEVSHLVSMSFPLVDAVQICRVDVKPAPQPVFLVGKGVLPEFHVRKGNASRPLDVKAALDYMRERWGRAIV
jgi:predicted HTH transcriptional regulator